MYREGNRKSSAHFFQLWISSIILIVFFTNPVGSRAGSISGKITTDGINGIAGVYAQVFIFPDVDPPVWVTNAVKTDSNGEYIIEGLADRTDYIVRFWANETNYVTRWYSDSNINGVDYSVATPITVAGGGDTLDVDIQLLLGGSISGTVTYHETGEPVVKALIDVYDSSEVWRGSAETDNNGDYQVVGLPDGPHKLQVFEVAGPPAGGLTEWYLDKASFDTATAVDATAGVDNAEKDVSLGGPIVPEPNFNWFMFTPVLTHRPTS
ncbi:MAG: carboxypeptidase regulatory-like domain-containing protein [Candidatus Electrothrix sp. AR5]|nr:carboxypeptidase regulatory-like domain-containing protein [Candidatus Electrothrix sp. AR5]